MKWPHGPERQRCKIPRHEWEKIQRRVKADLQRKHEEESSIPPEAPRFWSYGRVSTDKQVLGVSLEDQEATCGRIYKQLIDDPRRPHFANLVQMPHLQDGGVSALKKNLIHRPVGSQLHANLKPGDVVCIFKLDRGFRNALDQLETMKRWEEMGVTLISATENIDFSTAFGKMVAQVLAAVNEWYSNNLSELITARMLCSQKRVNKLQAPWGFRWIWNKREKTGQLKTDPDRRALGAKVLELRKGRLWREVSDIMEREAAERENRPPLRVMERTATSVGRLCSIHKMERTLRNLERKAQAAGLPYVPRNWLNKLKKKQLQQPVVVE